MKKHRNLGLSLCGIFFFCVCIVPVIANGGGNLSTKTSFSQSDLQGSWNLAGFGKYYLNPGFFTIYSSFSLDPSGNVTEGKWSEMGVDVDDKVTGGSLSITEKGSVEGFINSNIGGRHTLYGGQMSHEKDVIVYAGQYPYLDKGFGLLIKKSGPFSVADLEGTWVFPFEGSEQIGPSLLAFQGVCSMTIDNTGTIKDCTLSREDKVGSTCDGALSVSPQGAITGKMHFTGARTLDVQVKYGLINAGKTLMIFSGWVTHNFEGISTFAIKKGGTFSSHDTEGTWKISMNDYMNAIYGEVSVDGSGTVVGGNWKQIGSASGAFTGGHFAITDQGEISGFINTSTGITYKFFKGQMSEKKDFMGIIQEENAGHSGAVILLKSP
ncbi:MAG: hypothetical protein ACLPX5_13905 [Dissulfurispiraceae bacterium]